MSPEQTENYGAADGPEMVEYNEDRLVRSHSDTLEYAALFPLPPSPVALEAKLRITDDIVSLMDLLADLIVDRLP